MENAFSVDYDKKELVINFEGESFTFNLDDGDVSDFWHSFTTKEGIIKDINFYQEDYNETPSVAIYGVNKEEDGHLQIDMQDEIVIQKHTKSGDPFNYFIWHKEK